MYYSYRCTATYDPYYGMKIIAKGQVIIVNKLMESLDYADYRIILCDNNDPYPGHGMRIEASELSEHFEFITAINDDSIKAFN